MRSFSVFGSFGLRQRRPPAASHFRRSAVSVAGSFGFRQFRSPAVLSYPSPTSAFRRRYSCGVLPFHRLNARWNALGSENPSR